jgi:pro-kumamolisin-like protein/Big-like domain-containing protein
MFRQSFSYWFVMVASVVMPFGQGSAQSGIARAGAATSIASPIDEESRVILRGSKHPLATPDAEIGPVSPTESLNRMLLVLNPPPERQKALATLLAQQQDKRSAEFHHWLTPQEFGQKFGPLPEDVTRIRAWLGGKGFSIDRMATSGGWIEFSGTSAQVENAFRTQMRRYQVGGDVHIGNATDVSLPSAIAPMVQGIVSLNDFRKKPLITNYYNVSRNANGELAPDFTITGTSGTSHFLAPGDFAKIYNLGPLYSAGFDGAGQTIAIVARSDIHLADFKIFRQIFSLPDNDPNILLAGATLSGSLDAGDLVEASLDAEWAGALAPRATVDLVVAASTATTDGVDLSAAYIVDNNLAPVMSVSFGLCESAMGPAQNAFYNALWQQAAAEGITVFVSSGDNGAAGCDAPSLNSPATHGLAVNGIASTPFNTAVGGTQFNENGNDSAFWIPSGVSGASTLPAFVSVNGYIPEAAWNESCDPTLSTTCTNNAFNLFSGSGGTSTIYPVPDWQKLNIPGLTGANFVNRALPDVSLTAAGGHDGYLFCVLLDCDSSTDGNVLLTAGVVGGTSASAPSMAAIMSLISQKLGGRQGLINPVLYQFAATENFAGCASSSRTNPATASACVFNDVTQGNNSVPGQTGFNTGAGFDLATGLGSVDATNLANAWSALALRGSATTFGAATTTTVQHGQPITFSVAVDATDAAGGVPSGAVSLISDKFGTVGSVALNAGAFSGALSGLPGGQYNITAHYPGDGTFGPSDSTPVPVNITAENSSVALSGLTSGAPLPSGSTIVFGQFLAIHAAVSSASGNGVGTGTVTFTDTFNGNTSTLGRVAVDSRGGAEVINFGFFNAPLNLEVGTHVVNASYSGDSSLNSSSTSLAYVVNVSIGTAFPSLTASPDQINTGQQVVMHVFIGASAGSVVAPTGNVQFFDNGSPIGAPVAIASDVPGITPSASFQVALPVGVHTVLAQYLGDTHYAATSLTPDIFNSRTVTVVAGAGAATQTMLTASTSAPVAGQIVNYSATVTSAQSTPALTGAVELFDETGVISAPVTLVNGSAAIALVAQFAGPRHVVAQYSGDANYALSASSPLSLNVSRFTPSVSLSASAPNVNSGTQVSLTGLVSVPAGSPLIPSGTIQFLDSLNGGAPQPLGFPINVQGVHLSSGFAEGFKSEAVLGVTLVAGQHTLTASYSGDFAENGGTSNAVNVSVAARTASHISLAADSLTPAAGQTVHFSVNVPAAPLQPTPTGTVLLMGQNVGVLGSATLTNGTAAFVIPWSAPGFQAVTAQYSGDSVYASSESNLVTLTLPAFTVFTSANDLPVVAGQGAAVRLVLDPLAGFNAQVTFSCSGNLPAGASCSFSPGAQVTLNGATQTSFLILSTTAPLQPAAAMTARHGSPWWALSGITALACCFLVALPGRKGRSRAIVAMVMISVLSFAAGCGGGSGGPPQVIPTPTPRPSPSPSPSPTPTPTSAVTITSSAIKVASGDSVTFTANVKAPSGTAATGTMTFFDGPSALSAPVTLTNGQGAFTVSTLSVGTHAITAQYSGDAQNKPGTSSTLQQVITGSTQFQLVVNGGGQTTTINMRALIE